MGLPSDGKTRLKESKPSQRAGELEGESRTQKPSRHLRRMPFSHPPGCRVGGRLPPSLRESRSLLSLFLSLKSPFQGEQGPKEGLCHLSAACTTAQSCAGGAGERCRATMLPRPPSFWRQNHAKPWPAGREHPRLSWGGAGTFSRCKTVCRGILVALLPPIQLGGGVCQGAHLRLKNGPTSALTGPVPSAPRTLVPQAVGCRGQPRYLGFTLQADFETEPSGVQKDGTWHPRATLSPLLEASDPHLPGLPGTYTT